MHDPFAWSIPFGRLFGITVKVHWLFPFVAIGWVLHMAMYRPYREYRAPDGIWIDATIFMALLFVSVLLHEIGHCLAARSSGGEASEVLIWPLGGLANVELPNRPQAHLLTALAGPLMNLLLFGLCVLALLVVWQQPVQPVWYPFPDGFPYRDHVEKGETVGKVMLTTWGGTQESFSPYSLPVWFARFAWVNWFLALINLLLIGFPLDGGRILQASLWPSLGYRQATLTAVFAGFGMVFLVGLYSIIINSVLALALALFIFFACQRQWMLLEAGGEDGVFGYDFSQGYTSLERDPIPAAPPQPRISWWRRWLQRRALRRLQRQQEKREAEERRMDALLEKVHREGRQSLTDEEERFMKRVSDRYRRK
ncbi:MAG: site-2 protease family protein [Gemmataceae bacterium]